MNKPMTEEQAIQAIKNNYPDSRYTMLREALDLAIERLSSESHYKQRTEKLEQDKKQLFGMLEAGSAGIEVKEKRIEQLEQQLKQAVEVINFYAIESGYVPSDDESMIGYPPETIFDKGRKARAFLQQLKERG